MRAARRRNFFGLRNRLGDRVAPLRDRLDDGVCPLFFPLLVHDKPGGYAALRARNVGAVGFWNYGHQTHDVNRRAEAAAGHQLRPQPS